MLQLTQNLRNGKMEILEVPFPGLTEGSILVKNYYSVISSGTEGKSVKTARSGYISKAKEKPKEFRHVMELAKEKGLISTYKTVMERLDMPSPLGYCCAGEVIDIAKDISGLQIGDFVACGGGNAVHAEVVSIQKNLCVRVPDGVDIKNATFTTIGAIALQGIRQAELKMGENCVVIGLGLIGQLTVQLLNAGGIYPIGIDVDKNKVEIAEKIGAGMAVERRDVSLNAVVMDCTNGFGADAVIITAGTSSLDPINFAGELCRKKGRVVIVGNVPTGFSRENFYKKELDLRMSCSYGPGRYDTQYEEKGIDYPIGFARWTERRNMEAFLSFLNNKQIDVNKIITHTFDFKDALRAYETILNKSEFSLGILLKYDVTKSLRKKIELTSKKDLSSASLGIGIIGAGSFARSTLLPALSNRNGLIGIADLNGCISRYTAEKNGFQFCSGNSDDIIKNKAINTIFIATRHNLHSEFVIKALKNNKNVYVEKPLCMNIEELEKVKEAYAKKDLHLMVGFNRRFSPHIQKIKKEFSYKIPKAINYRINAGVLPSDHWIHDKEIGGGRIIGEVCHFVDLVTYIVGDKVTKVSAMVMNEPSNLNDTLVINLDFKNGSIAAISYFSNGNRKLRKEYLEIFSGTQVAIIDDFRKMRLYSRRVFHSKLRKQVKGHAEEIKKFLDSIEKGLPTPIAFEDIYHSTFVTFKILDSIKEKKTILL